MTDTEYDFRSYMTVRLTRVEGDDVDVARAAWASTKGQRAEDEADLERVSGLINMLMRDKHGSPFEQCGLQFLTTAPIFVWREHYRHRIASYNEQSGRYMQLAPHFYLPDRDRLITQVGTSAKYDMQSGTDEQYDALIAHLTATCQVSYERYLEMLDLGISKEVARMALPLNIFSTAYVRMNLRALMNFLSLRVKSSDSVYPSNPMHEINLVANEYEEVFEDAFPIVHAAFIKNGRVAP